MYHKGLWHGPEYSKAFEWYPKAAETEQALDFLGTADLELILGNFKYSGTGVAQDFGEARKWYRKAAGKGNIEAQYRLASIYKEGVGVKQSFYSCYLWANITSALKRAEKSIKLRDKCAGIDKPIAD